MKKKYNNRRVEYDGKWFDSEMERDFYIDLLLVYDKSDIELQPVFELVKESNVNYEYFSPDRRCINYRADFKVPIESYSLDCVIIDVKGALTDEFKLKEKLFRGKYGDVLPLLLFTEAPKYYQHKWIDTYALQHLRRERLKIKKGKSKSTLQEILDMVHSLEHEVLKKINNAVKNLDK